MKQVRQVQTLHITEIPVNGKEPFLSFDRAGLVLNLNQSGRSHNLIESFGAATPFSHLKKGDSLRIEIQRVSWVESPWYERAVRRIPTRRLRDFLCGWMWDKGWIRGDGSSAAWERIFRG